MLKCTRETAPGIQVIRLVRDRFEERFITISALEGEKPSALFERLDACLCRNRDARIVRKDVFGRVNVCGENPQSDACASGAVPCPVTWVGVRTCRGCAVAGVHVHTIGGVSVEPIRMDGRVVGAVFEDAYARYCLLGNIRPITANPPRYEQALRTFETMEAALRLAGMDFGSVVRTWLYLDDILSWYGDFNKARDDFFRELRISDGVVPASTAVGGSNSSGMAIVAELLAIEAKGDGLRTFPVPSPLQRPAVEYGSSFNRAVEVSAPDHRRLFISGTASISPEGYTVYEGDTDAQVAVTMNVVNAILESRGMRWTDVTRAVAYFKHGADAPAYDRYCAGNAIPPLPVVISENAICRDELLFELEVDAVAATIEPFGDRNTRQFNSLL